MDRLESFQPLIDLCTKDVQFKATIREGTPISGTFSGIDEVTRYFNEILPTVATFRQLKPLEFVMKDDMAVVLGDDAYTLVKNQVTHHSPYAMVLTLRDGRICEILIIQDLSIIWEAYH